MATRSDVLARALQLPLDERQKLIHELAVSLEGDPADDPARVEESWDAEIVRRAEAVASGTAVTVDGREVLERALREMRAGLPSIK